MPATPEWVALSLVDHLGGKRMRALLDRFGSPDAVLKAEQGLLRRVSGIGAQLAHGIGAINLARTTADLDRWAKQGVQAIAWDDDEYPSRLKRIEDAPPTLFKRGSVTVARLHECKHIAIVGTRQPNSESARMAQTLAFELAQRGAVIVSGLAIGVDANAHTGTLAVPDGVTLAVLGGGVLNVYPPANRALASAIIGRGALYSEQAPDGDPTPSALVARNRLISGMCDALVVIETSVTGGAMHAAKRAREQGCAVYALDVEASGNRALIAEGAGVIRRDLSNLEML